MPLISAVGRIPILSIAENPGSPAKAGLPACLLTSASEIFRSLAAFLSHAATLRTLL